MAVYKGWNAKIYKDGVQIGLADSASVEIATNLEAYYEIGSRVPTDLVEGNQEVTGSISKAWIDKNYLSLVTTTGTLQEFDLCFEVGSLKLYCYNCKFERGAVDIPQDGFLKEDYDFRAKKVAIV
ncbi:hypothetical protein DRH14_04240 [Candidatus Shapirobacteria bacterium]|nr:MAG: hypothetical protein DRH14_04240 [Candidatus Shapirobacteria bacterium]